MPHQHEQPLTVTTLFETSEGDEFSIRSYRGIIEHNLSKILPTEFFENQETSELNRQHREQIFKKIIPLVTYSEVKQFPCKISFYALSRFRSNSFKFFFEMISRWLTPGKRLNVALVYASDFRINDLSSDVFTFYEIVVRIEKESEFNEILHNFPLIQEEIVLGIHSDFYAQRLLEIKGLSADDKTAIIQDLMAYLIKRFPDIYDIGLFSEMQHVLITCRDDFKEARLARHLSRMISIQYLFRKKLREFIKKKSHKRHLLLKIFKTFVKTEDEPKRVLSILVGITFLKEQESFEQHYLLKAIQAYLPSVQPINNSYYIHKHGSENICLLYLEIEKKDGSDFTIADIRKLQRELPANLKNRVEHQIHPIFMPRNEEEVMRNMVILANQIRYLRDIPQIFVSFDEQVQNHLSFTVILARILKDNSLAVPSLFKKADSLTCYVHDRTKKMGLVRKKYPKEASVFHLKIPKEEFIRSDHSIDLYKARQKVVGEISKVFGEVRDYNGGMISKQQELLSEIKNQLTDVKEYDELLLENFFYSLTPVAQALVDPTSFKSLFMMLVEGIQTYKHENFYVRFQNDDFYQYVFIISEDVLAKEQILQSLQATKILHTEFIHAQIKVYGNSCMGFICSARTAQEREKITMQIEQILKQIQIESKTFLVPQ